MLEVKFLKFDNEDEPMSDTEISQTLLRLYEEERYVLVGLRECVRVQLIIREIPIVSELNEYAIRADARKHQNGVVGRMDYEPYAMHAAFTMQS